MLILCAGVRNADDGFGFIFCGLGGGGASATCSLQETKQINNRAAIDNCKSSFVVDVLYFKVSTMLLFFGRE